MQHLLHASYRATERCTCCIAVFSMSDLLFATISFRYSQSRSNFKIPEVFNPNWIFYEVNSNAILLLYNFMQNDELPHLFKSKWCFDHLHYFFYHYFCVSSISHYYIISMFVINQFYTLPLVGFELITSRYWWYIDLYSVPLGHPRAW